MLNTNIDYKDFQYVVERQSPQKVCFGSGRERPMSSDVKVETKANPMTYRPEKYTAALNHILNKPTSKKGTGGLASDAPRFPQKTIQQMPSPTTYNLQTTFGKVKKAHVPFGSKIDRQPLGHDDNPGPGVYEPRARLCRRSRTKYNFGNVETIPATESVCVDILEDECSKCNKLCGNDYWQMNYTTYLCHPCMAEEQELHEMYGKELLKKFKKIRNCSYMHHHENTHAALRLLPKNKIKKRERIENYLDLYLGCFTRI